jgi:hypothetical protein
MKSHHIQTTKQRSPGKAIVNKKQSFIPCSCHLWISPMVNPHNKKIKKVVRTFLSQKDQSPSATNFHVPLLGLQHCEVPSTEWLDLHWTKLSASNWTLIWGRCICLRLQQVGHELNMVEDVRGTLWGDAVAVWCRSSCCGFWDTPWYAHVRCFRCNLWFCFSPSIFVYRVYHRIFQSIPTNFIDCQFQS